MTKILVLGSQGMLGHMVEKVFSQDSSFKVVGTQYSDPNAPNYFNALSDINALSQMGCAHDDYIINCIGVLKSEIDESRLEPVERAIQINSLFPYRLAAFAKTKGARVIQISTNGVFSGVADSYDELMPRDSTDVYGKTKALGEVVDQNFLNIRCSIIGPSPIKKLGLFEWFKAQPDGATISGYTNHRWSGVTTLQFAQVCLAIIKDNHFDKLRKESAVYHFAPNRTISKYELLEIFKSALNKHITISPVEDPRGGGASPILVSRYNGLKAFFQHNQSIEDAVRQMFLQ